MKIVVAEPPIIERIKEVFPVTPNVIFAFGDTIYNPGGHNLSPSIIAHEEAHGARQRAMAGGAEEWWERYLVDPEWRYREEVIGHSAEYKMLSAFADRNMRAAIALGIAKKLTNKLYVYGSKQPTLRQAIKDLV